MTLYYLLAMPLALFLCFGPPYLELEGLWIGFVVGSMSVTCVEGAYLKCMDWRMAMNDVRKRGDYSKFSSVSWWTETRYDNHE